MSGTVAYWVIEASRDGISFPLDMGTFVQGSKKQADAMASLLQTRHPEGWIPGVEFGVRPLGRADLAEHFLA